MDIFFADETILSLEPSHVKGVKRILFFRIVDFVNGATLLFYTQIAPGRS